MPYYRDTPSEQQDLQPQDVEETGVVLMPEDLANYRFDAPHGDRAAWEKRICQVFGARQFSTAIAFLDQLTALCTISYDRVQTRWKPSELELNFAVGLIDSIRPRDQMEAALVAQMVAVHLMQMRVSSRVLGEQDVEARDANAREASVAAKLARTFAMQMETLARMRGKRSTRQNITVRHEKHVHHHQHQHIDAWACAPAETSPQPQSGEYHVDHIGKRATAIAGSPEVSRQDALGSNVPFRTRARKAGV